MFASRLDETYAVEVRRSVGALTVAKVGANSAVRFAPPFLATIASGLDVSLATLGGALAVGELAGLSAPALSRLAARLTRRSAICIGLLGIAAGASTCATSQGAVQFAIGLAVMNVSKIVFDVGVITWLSGRVAYSKLGRVIGLTETAWAGALFVGVVLMGLLTGLTSWRWGYALAVLAVVVLAFELRRRLPDEARPSPLPRAARSDRPRLGAGWYVVVGTLGLMAAAQAVFVTFGKWLEDGYSFSETKLAVVIFGLGGVELLASSGVVRFADIWGKQRSTMWGAAVIVPSGIGLALVNHTLVPSLALLGLYVCAFEFAIVSSLSLASNLVPHSPTTGLGLMIGAGTLGRAAMSAPAAAAYTRYGMWLPALMGAVMALVTFGCQWRYRSVRTKPFDGHEATTDSPESAR